MDKGASGTTRIPGAVHAVSAAVRREGEMNHDILSIAYDKIGELLRSGQWHSVRGIHLPFLDHVHAT